MSHNSLIFLVSVYSDYLINSARSARYVAKVAR